MMTKNIFIKKPHTMNDITGYQYIDEPANELLVTLPEETQKILKKIFKQIYSVGKTEGYHDALKLIN